LGRKVFSERFLLKDSIPEDSGRKDSILKDSGFVEKSDSGGFRAPIKKVVVWFGICSPKNH
jgi:hypothetical protein